MEHLIRRWLCWQLHDVCHHGLELRVGGWQYACSERTGDWGQAYIRAGTLQSHQTSFISGGGTSSSECEGICVMHIHYRRYFRDQRCVCFALTYRISYRFTWKCVQHLVNNVMEHVIIYVPENEDVLIDTRWCLVPAPGKVTMSSTTLGQILFPSSTDESSIFVSAYTQRNEAMGAAIVTTTRHSVRIAV